MANETDCVIKFQNWLSEDGHIGLICFYILTFLLHIVVVGVSLWFREVFKKLISKLFIVYFLGNMVVLAAHTNASINFFSIQNKQCISRLINYCFYESATLISASALLLATYVHHQNVLRIHLIATSAEKRKKVKATLIKFLSLTMISLVAVILPVALNSRKGIFSAICYEIILGTATIVICIKSFRVQYSTSNTSQRRIKEANRAYPR